MRALAWNSFKTASTGLSQITFAIAWTLLASISTSKAQAAYLPHITELRCESLVEPLGLDDQAPVLSWNLGDTSPGATQAAYRVEVFSAKPAANSHAPALWDTGRIVSPSQRVAYHGPALQPSTRYFWRVQVWEQGKTAPLANATSWWETGLLQSAAWERAAWIGHESQELASVRAAQAKWITTAPDERKFIAEAHYAFRIAFDVAQPVRSAVLYVTGDETPAAWIDGRQVLATEPQRGFRMPWMKYKRVDITAGIRPGTNMLAVEALHYLSRSTPEASTSRMNAALYLGFADGSSRVVLSDSGKWKAAVNPDGDWWQPSFDDSHWKTAQIAQGSDLGNPLPTGPVAKLRRTFTVGKQVVSARLYVTALGAYKMRLNGAQISDDVLSPGWMDFREQVPYQTYDVTGQLRQGQNVIGAYLAAGWYATPLRWLQQPNNYGDTQPALRAQLRVEYSDNTVEWISTGSDWRGEDSEITQAEIYDGESRDNRLAHAGWDTSTFNAAAWQQVTVVHPHEPAILAQFFQPIRAERTLAPRAITQPRPGVYIVDFGQNMAGVPRIAATGKRGQRITLRFGEILNADGTLYTENLRTAKATDSFILAGAGKPEVFEPQFTFHGFRYMEVTGLDHAPLPQSMQAVVLHTAAPITMKLETGSDMLNRLWSNILWGQRSNFVGVPTDCPQRDERLGWTADAQVFWRTAAYNMDLDAFTRKFTADMRGTQVGTDMYGIYAPGVDVENDGYATGWSDAGVIIPWTGWMQSGDTKIVDENWASMERYLNAIATKNPNHLWQKDYGTGYGDWLSPTIATPMDLIATAYWAYDVELMRQMAAATGRQADATKYASLHDEIAAAFQRAYVKQDGTVGAPDHYPSIPAPSNQKKDAHRDTDQLIETQTGYVLALHMGLLPESLRPVAAQRLVKMIKANDWHLGTGFLGTPYLLEELARSGHTDVAYRLLLNTTYPSWGYTVQHDATTMWERWNGDQMKGDPSMNSYNHYAYGSVAEWLYRYAAGIDTTPEGAGFHVIALHPQFDPRIGHIRAEYQSPYGPITSSWTAHEKQVTWQISIPAGTTGVLVPAATNLSSFTLDGKQGQLETRSPCSQAHISSKASPAEDAPYGYEIVVRNRCRCGTCHSHQSTSDGSNL